MGDFLSKLTSPLVAILLLVVAFIAAAIVKSLVIKLLKAIKAEALLAKVGAKEDVAKSAIDFVGKLAYFITFILFLPSVLNKLGMQSVSAPITSMANQFLAFIPNLVAAGIIIAVGLFIANIVKDLLKSILKAVKVDALQEKAGIAASEKTAFSTIIANVVYGVIVLIVVTTGLDQLRVPAISTPANAIVSSIFAIIPNVLAAIVIIAVGVFIAKLVAKLLEGLLASVGTDSLVEKVTGNASKKVVLSKVISEVVKYVLVVVFIVQGINVLELPVLTNIGAAVIGYLPAVLTAIIILALGMFAANAAENAIVKKCPNAKATALVVKVVIYVFVGFVCLSQLGVAISIVEETFTLIVTAVCIAFAIAFGVGGRTFAANMLAKLEKKLDNEEK